MNYQTLKMDEAKSQAQALGLSPIGDARKRLNWIAALELNYNSSTPPANNFEIETVAEPELEVEAEPEPDWEPVIKPSAVATPGAELETMVQLEEDRWRGEDDRWRGEDDLPAVVLKTSISMSPMAPGLIVLALCGLAIAAVLALVAITSKLAWLTYNYLTRELADLRAYNNKQRDRIRPEQFLNYQT